MATKKTATVEVTESMTPEMKIIKQKLYENFADSKIKERQGRAGEKWKFIDSAEYVHRLNEVFGVAWSVEEVKSEVAGTYLRTLVRITVPDPNFPERTWYKEAWASHPLADSRGKSYDPGDVAKSAYSKALVKACSMLGVGLTQLWGIIEDEYPGDLLGQDMPPWEGPDQFGGQAPQMPPPPMNVNIVNPGPHNMPPQGMQPTMMAPPPQMANPNPNMGMQPMPPQAPPPPQQQPLGPVPQMSNPNVGFTNGPDTPAAAQMQFQGAPPPMSGPPQGFPQPPPPPGQFVSQQQMAPPMAQMQQGTSGGIIAHQISAVRGAATMMGFPDPMILVRQVLGAEAQMLQVVEELTYDQAVRVLEYMKKNVQGV